MIDRVAVVDVRIISFGSWPVWCKYRNPPTRLLPHCSGLWTTAVFPIWPQLAVSVKDSSEISGKFEPKKAPPRWPSTQHPWTGSFLSGSASPPPHSSAASCLCQLHPNHRRITTGTHSQSSVLFFLFIYFFIVYSNQVTPEACWDISAFVFLASLLLCLSSPEIIHTIHTWAASYCHVSETCENPTRLHRHERTSYSMLSFPFPSTNRNIRWPPCSDTSLHQCCETLQTGQGPLRDMGHDVWTTPTGQDLYWVLWHYTIYSFSFS